MADECRVHNVYACGENVLHTSVCKDKPPVEDIAEYIRITTLPKQEYIFDEDTRFPIPIDFSGAVVKAFRSDGSEWDVPGYPHGTIDHRELTISPTEIQGGYEDTGAYYIFEGIDKFRIVNIQSDHTGGSVSGKAGVKWCAFMVGSSQYIIAVDLEPFDMMSATWDATGEQSLKHSQSYTYEGQTYQYVSERWYDPAPIPCVNYSRANNSSKVLDAAIRYIFGGEGHESSDSDTVTVSWSRPEDGEILTDSYEVYVH